MNKPHSREAEQGAADVLLGRLRPAGFKAMFVAFFVNAIPGTRTPSIVLQYLPVDKLFCQENTTKNSSAYCCVCKSIVARYVEGTQLI